MLFKDRKNIKKYIDENNNLKELIKNLKNLKNYIHNDPTLHNELGKYLDDTISDLENKIIKNRI